MRGLPGHMESSLKHISGATLRQPPSLTSLVLKPELKLRPGLDRKQLRRQLKSRKETNHRAKYKLQASFSSIMLCHIPGYGGCTVH